MVDWPLAATILGIVVVISGAAVKVFSPSQRHHKSISGPARAALPGNGDKMHELDKSLAVFEKDLRRLESDLKELEHDQKDANTRLEKRMIAENRTLTDKLEGLSRLLVEWIQKGKES